MKISEIKTFPTTLGTGRNNPRCHESVFRSYQILEKTKDLLSKGTPPDVLLEIIDDIESVEGIDKEI